MAKTRSTVFSSISGSVAGSTFSGSRGGSIVQRVRAQIVKFGSNGQTQHKAIFSEASAVWEGLTDNQRLEWANWHLSTFTDSPGLERYPTARIYAMSMYITALKIKRSSGTGSMTPTMVPPDDIGELVLKVDSIIQQTPGTPVIRVIVTNISSDPIIYQMLYSRHYSFARFANPSRLGKLRTATILINAGMTSMIAAPIAPGLGVVFVSLRGVNRPGSRRYFRTGIYRVPML